MDNTKSINTQISLKDSLALNSEGTGEVNNIFGYGGTVKSNKGDPELIITVKFLSNVNISGIKIESGMDDSKKPESMNLYVNNSNLAFSDIGNVKATETIDMSENIGKLIPLKVAKFRNVGTISVFIINLVILL